MGQGIGSSANANVNNNYYYTFHYTYMYISINLIKALISWGVVSPGCNCNYYPLCVCVPAGEFGVVYRGNPTGWSNTGHELVAVKTLKGMIILVCKQNRV